MSCASRRPSASKSSCGCSPGLGKFKAPHFFLCLYEPWSRAPLVAAARAPSTEPPPYPPQGIVPASCALSCAIDTKHRLGSDACVFCCISCFSMTAWRSPRALAPASIAIQTLVVRLTSDMVVQQAWNHGLGARRASFRASLDFIFLRSMKYRCVDAPPPHQNAASMNAPRQHQHSARQGSPS